jgi:MinD-like ATPase involved in chromosome partitioning or flagellar assembly
MLKVSFYSYKGGAGRSTTLWNTIERLVDLMPPTAQNPFVIVDTDIESAGSTFLYKADEDFFRDEEYLSVQTRMICGSDTNYTDPSDAVKKSFFKSMRPIGTFFGLPKSEENAVLFIGVNLHRGPKSTAKDVVDDGSEKASQLLDNFSYAITSACEECGAKALFFDTPSGTQFLARKSIQESDIIVCCMRPTDQFLSGTKRQLINFIDNDVKAGTNGKRKYILTPTAICVDAGQEFMVGDEKCPYPGHAKDVIVNTFDADNIQKIQEDRKKVFKENVIMDMLNPTPSDVKMKMFPVSDDSDSVFGIPEIKRFKWFETCLGKLLKSGKEEELSSNDKMALNRYEYLAQTILKYRQC